MAVLTESAARHPDDRDTLVALVTYNRDAGDFASALEYAQRLIRLEPDDLTLNALIENLRRQTKDPDMR